MRDDMQHLLVSRGRGPQDRPYRNREQSAMARGDYEKLPKKSGMRPKGTWRNFGDHLAPLYRYMRSRVGKPWDDTFQEMSDTVDPRNIRGWHMLSHIESYLNFGTVVRDAGADYFLTAPRYGSRETIPLPLSYFSRLQNLYVDTEDGLLKELPHENSYRVQLKGARNRKFGWKLKHKDEQMGMALYGRHDINDWKYYALNQKDGQWYEINLFRSEALSRLDWELHCFPNLEKIGFPRGAGEIKHGNAVYRVPTVSWVRTCWDKKKRLSLARIPRVDISSWQRLQ